MSQARVLYVNGDYVAENEARISAFDRGFIFADAVYEVCAVLDGRLVDFAEHMARLRRSLSELAIAPPLDEASLFAIHQALIARNQIDQGLVYLQVSRGASDREFVPGAELTPTVVLFTQHKPLYHNPIIEQGLRVVSLPDLRWGRRDIKTVQLLPAALAKMQARRQGADDAWLVEEGYVNEGTSSNAWIVEQDGALRTPRLSTSLLPGITRAAVKRYATETDMTVREKKFTIAEAQDAREAFITSATSFVIPVVEIDGQRVGNGRPGPVGRRLLEIYVEESRRRQASSAC